MPYKNTALKIPTTLDRRVKLTPEQRKEIKELYKTGEYSQRKLARMFEVSRRLISFYIDDARLEHHRERSAERRMDGRYYDRDKHRAYTKSHRRYKRQLELEGKLES